MSPTNANESSQAKSPAPAATQTFSDEPALNTDSKYAQDRKEYKQAVKGCIQAMEGRETKFKTRSTQKIERMNAIHEEFHTKLMSPTAVSKIPTGKLALQDFHEQVLLLLEELIEIQAELADDLERESTQSLSGFAK
ncbi:uncharacterized protein FIESC28_01616 [Fusarium coffeatum]|uniref:Uncharacterized protein n=1 Tax=Fusarium coffeatum TaxID=231269 RepID=A0A366S8I8_9HYPO|nr:uncharacterized protein FIESC28_01616 [Fusarium coffeatum]RBR25653.1 hypothetical protein FIESC28_01616 [Fusarium coffeatum]